MDVHAKTQEWVDNRILTDEERQALLSYEAEKHRPFRILAFLWLGLFTVALGLITWITDTRFTVSPGVKGTIWIGITGGSIGFILHALRHHKRVLLESVLFFTFLIVGGGIGLIAQVFDLPIDTPLGLLIWAALSLIIILASKHKLLSLLWFPLFLGGILGSVRWEFLLLFLTQAPVATTCLLATVFGIGIWYSGNAKSPFFKALNHWCIALFYLSLLLGENGIMHPLIAFLVTTLFLCLFLVYTIHFNSLFLFNLTLLILAIRLIILALDLMHFSKYGSLVM